MRVLLLEDVRGLGNRGEIKNVSDGHARNFLIPRGIVRPATARDVETQQKTDAKLVTDRASLKETLVQLEKASAANPVVVKAKVGDSGKLFAAVSPDQIKEALVQLNGNLPVQLGVRTKKPAKELGRHEVDIDLGVGVKGSFVIEVKPLEE